MAAVIDCPSCNRKLNLPDDLLGREVRCPGCNFTFTAAPASETGVPPLRPELVREEAPPSKPPAPARLAAGRIGDEPCPMCGRPVPDDAIRCAYCGAYMDQGSTEEPPGDIRRGYEPDRSALIMALGLISLACSPLAGTCCFLFFGVGFIFSIAGLGTGIPAWVMGQKDLARMREYIMDPAGRPMTQAGMICGIIGTILCAIGLLLHASRGLFMLP
jgi:DNA-directed RNA polymerase subunit RPC12/RpoP